MGKMSIEGILKQVRPPKNAMYRILLFIIMETDILKSF